MKPSEWKKTRTSGLMAFAARIASANGRLNHRLQSDGEGFQRLQRIARSLPEDAAVRDWGAELMMAALVYRVGGEASLLTKIRKALRATIDHYLLLHDFKIKQWPRWSTAASGNWESRSS